MIVNSTRQQRRAASVVECAVVYPVTLLLLLGIIVGGLGVFRYQEVASLAREGARWASVRGDEYNRRTGKPAATAADVRDQVRGRAAIMDPDDLTCTVTWDPNNRQGSKVTVTVSYPWVPEVFFAGPVTLSSTATATVAY